MAKFEAHITFNREDSDMIEGIADLIGWSYSAIDGDPVIGKGPKCYLTTYSTNKMELYGLVERVSGVIKYMGIEVLRAKIEQIIYDTKTGVNEIE